MSDSPIVRFYSGDGTDSGGRTLADDQGLDAAQMEYYHDFIQWLFPLRQPSAYNRTAPTLTDEDVAAFHDRPDLRDRLRSSFLVFLRFLGLEFDEKSATIRPSPVDPGREKVFQIPNHNWLRITRVLLCLKTLGLDGECQAFHNYLMTLDIPPDTARYWSDAAQGLSR